MPQSDEDNENPCAGLNGSALRRCSRDNPVDTPCLRDIDRGILAGLLDPEKQLEAGGYAAASALGFTAADTYRATGRSRVIVPMTGRQIAARGAKRFIPGYAIGNVIVAVGSGGAAAVQSEACQAAWANFVG